MKSVTLQDQSLDSSSPNLMDIAIRYIWYRRFVERRMGRSRGERGEEKGEEEGGEGRRLHLIR